MKKTLFFFALAISFATETFAYLPKRRDSITLVNNGSALTNYKLLVEFQGASFISAGLLQPNFNDIRFSNESICPTTFYTHCVERVQAGAGRMWVDLPTFPTGLKIIYMYFGDSSAPTGSECGVVFPNSYIAPVGVTTTLTGNVGPYDWFEIPASAIVTTTPGTTLNISATRIKIDGKISAIGKGYARNGSNSNGGGPGGGTFSPLPATAGAGGGSYGAKGGKGGFDSGDTPGQSGPVYGTASGTDIDFGSAGGSSPNCLGGNGGGAVILNALKGMASVQGTIDVSGDHAAVPTITSSLGGGGGAGGSIHIIADYIDVSNGTLTSVGGNGSDFPISPTTVKDGGGGGSGGRIKYFYGIDLASNNVIGLTSGGVGGKNGDAAQGENGIVGTITNNFVTPFASFAKASVIDLVKCFPQPVTFDVFNLSKSNEGVVLNWETISEQNVSHFNIEKSADGLSFKNTGSVVALLGSGTNKYEYLDKNPFVGLNYYRIQSVDFDGKTSYTQLRNILIGENADTRIYPNPANDILTIVSGSMKKGVDVVISNQIGQVVLSTKVNSSNATINVSHLAKGLYYIAINGKTQKFSKD
jgi:hypothetical protein